MGHGDVAICTNGESVSTGAALARFLQVLWCLGTPTTLAGETAVAQQSDTEMTRDEAGLHWGLTYVREDIQELRREIRDLARDSQGGFNEMRREMTQRFNRQTATMIALTGAIIAAIRL